MSESSPIPPAELKLLDIHEVREKVGLGTSTIYRMMKDGEFPTAVPIAPRTVRWLANEVDAWISEKVVAARGAPMTHGRAA